MGRAKAGQWKTGGPRVTTIIVRKRWGKHGLGESGPRVVLHVRGETPTAPGQATINSVGPKRGGGPPDELDARVAAGGACVGLPLRPCSPSGTPGKGVTQEAEKSGSVRGIGSMLQETPFTAVPNSPSPGSRAAGAPLAVGLGMQPVPVNEVQGARELGAGAGAGAEEALPGSLDEGGPSSQDVMGSGGDLVGADHRVVMGMTDRGRPELRQLRTRGGGTPRIATDVRP